MTPASTPFHHVSLTLAANHAVIRLERPERLNAMTFPMIAEIRECVRLCGEADSVKSVVIRGAGRSFCSGDNLNGMGPTAHPNDAFKRIREESYWSATQALRDLDKPVITAAHGHALGAGLELFMAGDIRLVTTDAALGIPFSKMGITGGTYELPRLVGLTKAAAMLFSGEPISGAEAAACGLATECVSDEAALDAASDRWTNLLATRSTQAIGLMKRSLYRSLEQSADEALALFALNFVTATSSGGRRRTARTGQRADDGDGPTNA